MSCLLGVVPGSVSKELNSSGSLNSVNSLSTVVFGALPCTFVSGDVLTGAVVPGGLVTGAVTSDLSSDVQEETNEIATKVEMNRRMQRNCST